MQNDEKLHLIQTRAELSASSSGCGLSVFPFFTQTSHSLCSLDHSSCVTCLHFLSIVSINICFLCCYISLFLCCQLTYFLSDLTLFFPNTDRLVWSFLSLFQSWIDLIFTLSLGSFYEYGVLFIYHLICC